MRFTKRILSLILAGAMAVSLVGCSGGSKTASNGLDANGEWKPSSSINIRVPFAAGGSADTIARIAAKGMEATYGQTAVVNNLTGANGAIAANDLLSKNPAPTEMMVAGIGLFTLAPLFNSDIKVNLDDFQIVGSLIAEDFVLLSAPEKTGVSDFEGLMEYGKDKRIVCAGNPSGGTTHLLAKALFGEAGIECEVLSEDGGSKNALAVASGDADCCIVSANAALQYVQDGSLVPLACFSEEDYTGYEGHTVPTVKDKGYDIVFKSCNFLMTKKGVDPAVTDKIYQDMLAYRETDEFKELAGNASYIPDNQNGEEVRKTVEDSADFCKEMYEKYYAGEAK